MAPCCQQRAAALMVALAAAALMAALAGAALTAAAALVVVLAAALMAALAVATLTAAAALVVVLAAALMAALAREMPPAYSCQLKVFPMTGWGLQQLNGNAWQNILAQYMSGFLKMVWMSTLAPWHFSQKIHKIFPSVNHRQSVNTQPTYPPCVCLTGWLSAAKPAGHVWPRLTCKENRHFHWAKGHSLWPSPPPRG